MSGPLFEVAELIIIPAKAAAFESAVHNTTPLSALPLVA